MFGNMMEQLQQMKQQMEASKQKLDRIYVDGTAPGAKVKVTMNGNRKVTAIAIDPSLQNADSEELEDLLIMAFNHAMEQAEKVNEAEMQSAARGFLPGMGM